MSYFEYGRSDISKAIDLAIEETMAEITRKIMQVAPSVGIRDPMPHRTGRDEALGASTKIGVGLIKERVWKRLDG